MQTADEFKDSKQPAVEQVKNLRTSEDCGGILA
jgi:hypothetical protein